MSGTPAMSTYDTVVYDSRAYPATHPDLLRTLAWLFGIEAPPVEHCRVLELGCGTGANLIPLAVALPESRFVGIDSSARQVEIGQQQIRQLGLTNIQLRQEAIQHLDPGPGSFDYVICHGVYSWVPDEAQEAILRICRTGLVENGVAYVSYNTLPGWHVRGMVREMMVYHDRWHKGRAPGDRVTQARALLDFLARSTRHAASPHHAQIRQELEQLQQTSDSYLFHEHLEEHNEPVYFHQFNDRLGRHQLRFLAEADIREMVHHQLPAEVGKELTQLIRGLLEMQQYLDFITNRTFRRSLVCHERQRPQYGVEPARLDRLRLASRLRPAGGTADLRPGVSQEFAAPQGLKIASTDPVVKAALGCLAEAYPEAVPFPELCRRARGRLGGPATAEQEAADRAHLGGNFLHMYTMGGTDFVELWSSRPPGTAAVSDRPVTSPLVRLMAREGPVVTNLRHHTMGVDPFDRQVLPLLDGTHPRGALLQHLLELFRSGVMGVEANGQPIREELQARPVLAERLDERLKLYSQSALLLA